MLQVTPTPTNCLTDVMIGFVEVVEARRTARREAEERRRQLVEEERRRQEAAARWEREKDRREEFKREMEVWFRAREARLYLAALKEAATEHVEREPDGRLSRWLRWAERYAAQLDPLAEVASLPRDPEGYGRTAIDLTGFGGPASGTLEG
jgi:hypothetical protein